MTRIRALIRLSPLAIAACAALACGDLPHANPYDPDSPMRVSVTGPDSSRSIGDTLEFKLTTRPVWTGKPPVWSELGAPNSYGAAPGNLVSLGNGRFLVHYASPVPLLDRISVVVGGHVVSRSVWLAQDIVAVRFPGYAPGDTIHEDVLTGTIEGAYSMDARGNTGLPATVVSRDSSVVAVVKAGLVPRGLGSTWLVATFGSFVDSNVVKVWQQPAYAQCGDPFVRPGDSLQLHAQWSDRGGRLMDSIPQFTWFIQSLADSAVAPGTSMEITPTGMVHSHSIPNAAVVGVHWYWPDSSASGTLTACTVRS